jgi:(R,R)-butanediol dehydrogenase/meso-butanediol dehydrogenase/diacetyl reductase
VRAAVFVKGGELLQVRDLPDPEPDPDEVVLRVHRCGICGTDLHFTEGHEYGAPPGFVVGHEMGAEVVAVGKDVEQLKVGDHVVPHPVRGCGKCVECLSRSPYFCSQMQLAMGGFGQYMKTNWMACARMPQTLSLADAALIEPMAVGLMGMERNPFPIGSKIAVVGAGAVGLTSIYWARRCGAGKIVAIATSRQREGLARAMGADAFLTTGDTVIQELTEELGGLADVVIECAGVPGSLGMSVDMVKPRGSVTVLGLCYHPDPWVPAIPILKEVKLHFAVGTTLDMFERAADYLSAGHTEPLQMVTATVSLTELPEMFESLRHRNKQCKVTLDPWAP